MTIDFKEHAAKGVLTEKIDVHKRTLYNLKSEMDDLVNFCKVYKFQIRLKFNLANTSRSNKTFLTR